MVGRVTGVVGDTFAKMTLDEDFQGKRQQQKVGSVGQGLEGAAKVRWESRGRGGTGGGEGGGGGERGGGGGGNLERSGAGREV